MAKKLAEDNESARRVAEEQVGKMQVEFENYLMKKRDEHNRIVAGT